VSDITMDYVISIRLILQNSPIIIIETILNKEK